ncbi:MAG: NYN domain-containing protein [Candidatus Omnitrophota bacterium]
MNVLVIDGYNVIARGLATNPKRDMADEDARRGHREELVRLAKRLCSGKKGLEVRIYFDGSAERSAPELSDRSVKVFFAKGDQGADNAIIKFCRAHPKPKDIEVASDDFSTLVFHIRSHVGRILTVAEVMRRLNAGGASQGSQASSKAKDKEPLSDGTRQSINQTLPSSWFR